MEDLSLQVTQGKKFLSVKLCNPCFQDDKNDVDEVPPVNNEVNLDDDDLGVSEINLDDDDDIFKSARLEPEPAKMMQEPEVVKSNGGGAAIQEPVVSSGAALTNGHHKDQVRAESEEPVETDIPLEVIIVSP